ncbi:hypothetical protein M2171_003406 [Bradyrhizobium japonicum USDA 38]|nr:hypothetical protein [Bradyrhizobium japonicum]MCS3894273.1 hypothetical protein [Bradyrhizobium japonicum USDA 38]MCS3946787.1 hypothetical protein [Bradyrhizobium japonicum]MCW2220438.1 hypothetical protein [Bradyrhizobium japonicum]MCW2345052.1 hypothetical protein [Bradyrhizobium japonicum]
MSTLDVVTDAVRRAFATKSVADLALGVPAIVLLRCEVPHHEVVR